MFTNTYQELEKLNNIEIIGIISSNKKEKTYNNIYEINVNKINKKSISKNIKLYISINKKDKTQIDYGDKISIKGEYIKPETQRNYKGFNYLEFLKTKNIYGTVKTQEIEVLNKEELNPILQLSNKINTKIKEEASKILPKEIYPIFIGLILGDVTQIEEEIQEDFRVSSLSHILAISGMHISYIIIGVLYISKKIFGNKIGKIITIFSLIIYALITGFSPSIIRAEIMGIVMLFSNLVYRKSDIWTNISLSLIAILMYNPYLITNIGLQLSYGGTIGIIIFNKNINNILKKIQIKNKKIKYKINKKLIILIDKTKEIISIILSAQVAILPIMIYHFNVLGIYFIISNMLVSIIIGPIIIIGIIFSIFIFLNSQISIIISVVLNFGINILIQISKISSNLIFSKIYISTPAIYQLIIAYLLIMALHYIIKIKTLQKLNMSQIRILNLIELVKYKIKNKYKIKLQIFCLFVIIIYIIINIIPKNLEINFIDVGQGDSCLITTPKNKTILIDGGGSENKDFDIGKSTLLPYILDKGYTKIDYIIISHFDQDHVGGIITLMKEIEVGKVFISKQIELSNNYKEVVNIINEKNIEYEFIKKGNKINIENDVYFDVLWPKEEQIKDNVLNNNAIVTKLNYNNFSMIFTGDIEEKAEKEIVEIYKNSNKLQSTILKVAHHGSKSSSTEEFLNNVKPKIALIGVGEKNTFEHPNSGVLERLKRT